MWVHVFLNIFAENESNEAELYFIMHKEIWCIGLTLEQQINWKEVFKTHGNYECLSQSQNNFNADKINPHISKKM